MTWSLLGGTKSLAVEQPVQNGPFRHRRRAQLLNQLVDNLRPATYIQQHG